MMTIDMTSEFFFFEIRFAINILKKIKADLPLIRNFFRQK